MDFPSTVPATISRHFTDYFTEKNVTLIRFVHAHIKLNCDDTDLILHSKQIIFHTDTTSIK